LAVVVSHYREAIAQLEAVKADASTELKLRAELAGCYESFGDVLGHSGVPNLGDRKGAREAYEKGLNIYESILHEQPQDSHAQGGAAVLRAKIGDLRADEGDAAGALFSYKEAAPALDSLAAADPLNTALRRKVGWIHGKLARAYEAVGQNEAAQAEYARGIDGDRQAMLADPTNVQAREDYAVALKNRAEREYTAKHLPDALADYRLVADLLRPLANEPGNIAARGRYAYMLMMEGSVLGDLHRLDEAKAVYGDGLLVYKALADRPEATADDFDTYAEGLLEAPVKELLNPAAAVVYAKRAVEATKGGEWTFLDRLALSYSKTGDYANASKFEEQALRLMSPSPDRTAAEKRLIAFRSGVK
jgi:tetratricopeptide (TPR) repeat protein